MSLVSRHKNSAAASQACGNHILKAMTEAVEKRGRAHIGVSGGSSPKPMFELFAGSGFAWDKVDIYWVDERCVPIDDPQSNYKMALETWLAPARVPESSIHRVETEYPPEEAARRYAEQLQEVPRFDIIHRGMGADAHTASLFPGEPLILDRTHLAAAVFVEKFQQWRVTMLPAVLLAARDTVMLATGADKAPALDAVLTHAYSPTKYPAQLGARRNDNATWYVDEAAATMLPPGTE